MILLTGATGFLGSHILQVLLDRDLPVRVLVRNPENRHLPWKNLVEVYEGDILDVEAVTRALDGVETVIHNAALVSFQDKDKEDLMEVNVSGTANMVNLSLEAGVQAFLQVSSIAALGDDAVKPIDEHTPRKEGSSKSAYSESKYRAELEVYRGIAEGLHAYMINPGAIMGPMENWSSGTGNIFQSIFKGMRFYPSGQSGWVGAKDVARAVGILLNQEIKSGERFVLVNTNWTFQKIFERMAFHLGVKPPSMKVPYYLALAVAFLGESFLKLLGRDSLITVQAIKSAGRIRTFDGSKIEGKGFSYDDFDEITL